ncbi:MULTISPECIES: cell wall synthesis protein CwsA [Mycobacteriaceae]|uniref:cell wall synthesis protein CwsA n=1 Tax=Mycobacteriaceae TaxID=1762 RepID=UPI00080065A1|nr:MULTISPECIES: cell wall synthesis protein CwsA [Mycobacteriaceae]MCK0176000.1 cell wall synthesis protein CwsA [Mycolicibacterium sp. F2034L]OBB56414.1 cell wall synthesis protein CwsA [Mycobacterium sp. 852013-51886_SCH5428379]
MSLTSSLPPNVPLPPRQRLARGLKYTAVGPVDVTRGVIGIGMDSTATTAAALRKQYRKSQLRKELAAAQQTAQELVSNLPQKLQPPRPKRRKRPVVIAGIAVAVLAVGGVTFSIVRRSTQPEPSPLPPSVEVTPKP